MKPVLINPDIPRTMTLEGLRYLGRLARAVPQNGLIVEVGPLFGSSTWVLAKNSHPSVRVISIDTWEPAPWIKDVEAKFPGCKPFSKETFQHYTADCPNVTAVQGWSPQVMGDFKEPIDMFFDDATHGDPGFTESLNYYLPRLREGGFACGDDFASGWPDIVSGVSRLAIEWKTFPEIIGRAWAMVKPTAGASPPSVYSRIGAFSDHDIVTSVRLSDGTTLECPPGGWAGFLHQNRSIVAVRMDWAAPRTDLGLMYQVMDASGRRSAWCGNGEWAIGSTTLKSVRAHLTGAASVNFQLAYQGNQVAMTPKRKLRSANSKEIRDGRWIEWADADRSANLSALRVFVLPAAKPDLAEVA